MRKRTDGSELTEANGNEKREFIGQSLITAEQADLVRKEFEVSGYEAVRKVRCERVRAEVWGLEFGEWK